MVWSGGCWPYTRSRTLEALLLFPTSSGLSPLCHSALWHRKLAGSLGFLEAGPASPDKILKLAKLVFKISSLCPFSWSRLHYIFPGLLREGFWFHLLPFYPPLLGFPLFSKTYKDPEVGNYAWPHLGRVRIQQMLNWAKVLPVYPSLTRCIVLSWASCSQGRCLMGPFPQAFGNHCLCPPLPGSVLFPTGLWGALVNLGDGHIVQWRECMGRGLGSLPWLLCCCP